MFRVKVQIVQSRQHFNLKIMMKFFINNKDNIVMSESARKSSLNKDTLSNNQTIFEFLKRKRQFNLEQTVNHSLVHSSTKKKVDFDLQEDFPQTRDLTKYRTTEQHHSYTSRPNITPKKITFEEPQQTVSASKPEPLKQHRRGKSFVSMISPIKTARPSSALTERDQNRQKYVRSQVKRGKTQNFNQKSIAKSMNLLKQMLSKINQNVQAIRSKSHSVSVLFRPIFNAISSPNQQIVKQASQLKNKLINLQTLIEQSSKLDTEQLISQLQNNIEDHIKNQLDNLKVQYSNEKEQQLSTMQQKNMIRIQNLQKQVKQLQKENELLRAKLEKIENQKDLFHQQISERQINHIEQLERFKTTFQLNIQELTSQNTHLKKELELALETAKEGQKKYKNQKIIRQSIEERHRQEVQEITEAKDTYLLNEILVLKAQFNSDIAKINDLHKIKEAELMNQLQKKEEELSRKSYQKNCDRQVESRLIEEANKIKQQNLALKSQSQCIITDMYRLNEQLYQHWMALKDIKMLTTRLGSFVQLKTIYEDVKFNDFLFN